MSNCVLKVSCRPVRNTVQAAARILALAAVADGELVEAEIGVMARLPLARDDDWDFANSDDLHAEFQGYCRDLLYCAHLTWDHVCPVDDNTLVGVLGEVDDPILQAKLIEICDALVRADDNVTQAEAAMLMTMRSTWSAGQLHSAGCTPM